MNIYKKKKGDEKKKDLPALRCRRVFFPFITRSFFIFRVFRQKQTVSYDLLHDVKPILYDHWQ